MSLGQLTGLDTNALMSQSTSPTTTMVNADSAQDAGAEFFSQIQAGQYNSVSVNTPSVVKAAASASDRLPLLTYRNREVPTAESDGSLNNIIENDTSSDEQGTGSGSGEESAPNPAQSAADLWSQLAENGPVPTEEDLQNMSYDYNGDGVVTPAEAQTGLIIEQGIVNVGITIGGQAVMDMRTQMERDRVRNERIARGG